jgi:hypothetical protein
MKKITYFAYAMHNGRLEQLLVTRGTERKQEWTGKTYKTVKEANADSERLNCGR